MDGVRDDIYIIFIFNLFGLFYFTLGLASLGSMESNRCYYSSSTVYLSVFLWVSMYDFDVKSVLLSEIKFSHTLAQKVYRYTYEPYADTLHSQLQVDIALNLSHN